MSLTLNQLPFLMNTSMNATLPQQLKPATHYEIVPHPDHPRLQHLRLDPQALSESMENSSGTRTVSLPVGERVVLNNCFYLHGRVPFERHEHLHRELMRQRGTFAQ